MQEAVNDDNNDLTRNATYTYCKCGSGAFFICDSEATGLTHIVCAKCETDFTFNVWEGQGGG